MKHWTKIERAARDYAIAAHAGQHRKYTCEPYVTHPIAVARAARDLGMAEEAVVAAFLHDVVEDCGKATGEIRSLFGERVAFLVDGMTDRRDAAVNRAERKRRTRQRFAAWCDSDLHTLKALDLIDNAESIREHDQKFWAVFRLEANVLCQVLELACPELRPRLEELFGAEGVEG